MKLLKSNQIRNWDQQTISNESISSVELMERAANVFTHQFLVDYADTTQKVIIFCGPGNNGGDGLVVGRLLSRYGYSITLYLASFGIKKSPDFELNLRRIPKRQGINTIEVNSVEDILAFDHNHVVIDALFGLGLNRALEDSWVELISRINEVSNETVSIDIPSGLQADKTDLNANINEIIRADKTYTFHIPKLSMLFDEMNVYTGEWKILDIGLDQHFIQKISSPFHFVDLEMIKSIRIKRRHIDHKGIFGHAYLIVGSKGKIGSAILSAEGCLRSGVGLVTIHTPKYGILPLQTACPEAMLDIDQHEFITSEVNDISNYQAVGLGCGLGTNQLTANAIGTILDQGEKLVLDADALNILSTNNHLIKKIPKGSILTPHPREFERLFGKVDDPMERMELQISKSQELDIYIVYKGHNTRITTPSGNVYFNSTGNHGMATAGSGDVLTGIITGLLAQGYSSKKAAIFGVYLHGLSGDIAADKLGHHALLARDIVRSIGLAFKTISA